MPRMTLHGGYEPRLHIVLHQPEIPYNTGSVGRTCVAVGAKLWLVRPLGFRVDDYYLRRAGLDYWEHLAWQVVDNWDELQTNIAARPTQLVLHEKGTSDRTLDAAFQPGDVLVFGSESAGLPDSLLEAHPPTRNSASQPARKSAASTFPTRSPWPPTKRSGSGVQRGVRRWLWGAQSGDWNEPSPLVSPDNRVMQVQGGWSPRYQPRRGGIVSAGGALSPRRRFALSGKPRRGDMEFMAKLR